MLALADLTSLDEKHNFAVTRVETTILEAVSL
jgi:hypothetical protein